MQGAINVQHAVLSGLQELPLPQQKQVLDFIESLKSQTSSLQPRQGFQGLWADLDIDLSEADITESQQEMWADFSQGIEV